MKYPKSWKDVAVVMMTTVTMAIVVLASSLGACAQDASSAGMKPLLVVSLAGYDELIKDIDFLVEFTPGTRPFEILALGADLEEALGVKVDVGEPGSLRQRLREKVLAEAIPL